MSRLGVVTAFTQNKHGNWRRSENFLIPLETLVSPWNFFNYRKVSFVFQLFTSTHPCIWDWPQCFIRKFYSLFPPKQTLSLSTSLKTFNVRDIEEFYHFYNRRSTSPSHLTPLFLLSAKLNYVVKVSTPLSPGSLPLNGFYVSDQPSSSWPYVQEVKSPITGEMKWWKKGLFRLYYRYGHK